MSNLPARPLDENRASLGTPAELVAALPYLLGFPPRESVVAVGLDADHVVCLTLRLDLPVPRSEQVLAEQALAERVAGHLRNAGSRAAVVVIVTETRSPDGRLPRMSLIRALRTRLERAGIGLQDALCVRSGRWWSYVCADPLCCPPDGRQVEPEPPGAFVAAMVAGGRAVQADRSDLVASLTSVRAADDVTWQALTADAARRRAGRDAVITRVEAVLAARTESAPPLTDQQAAEFCVALGVASVRDACLRWMGGPFADQAESLWLDLVRAAPETHVAPPATLLAFYAYARGDGTFARICVERALAASPGYTMAELLRNCVDAGVGPALIRELAGCVEVCGGDR